MLELPLISISILLPLFSSLYITLFIGHSKSQNRQIHTMYVAALGSFLVLISTTYLLLYFDNEKVGFQFLECYQWIPAIGLEFHVGVDGLSVFFIFLTSLITFLCIMSSIFTIKYHVKEFLLCFLILETLCIGAFSSINLLLFFIFFEAMLIPLYVIIGTWGGKDRLFAATKFFIYTFFGSILTLISLIYIYLNTGTFDLTLLPSLISSISLDVQKLLWLMIFVTLIIKLPMPPFHTWLPSAHVEAPTSGSVMLAAVLLKISGYAMIRVLIPIFPLISQEFSPYILYLSGFTIIYASIVAFVQSDMKKMIAYSSIAHMGYVTAGLFTFTYTGVNGAIFQMLSHGLISAILFFIVGMLYERSGTRQINQYSGVAISMPLLSIIFMFALLGAIGLPGLSGFIGEFLVINGTFEVNIFVGVLCTFGVVLSAVYMLSLYKNVMLGEIVNKNISNFSDLNLYEKCVLVLPVSLMILIGLYPNIILKKLNFNIPQLVDIFL